MTRYRGRCSHCGADQMRSPTKALTTFEVSDWRSKHNAPPHLAYQRSSPGTLNSQVHAIQNPASMKILSNPSFSACSFTRPEPGTTSACVKESATLRPLTTSAAALTSSIRELVQEPINYSIKLYISDRHICIKPHIPKGFFDTFFFYSILCVFPD